MRRWLITTIVTALAGFVANKLADRSDRGRNGGRSRGRRR